MKTKWAVVSYYDGLGREKGYVWSTHNDYDLARRAARKKSGGFVGLKEVPTSVRAGDTITTNGLGQVISHE